MKFELTCESCEAEFTLDVTKPPDEDEPFDVPYPDGVYCPICSSYIELEDDS